MFKRTDKPKVVDEKIIDIQTGMQGNVKFSGPINIRISGEFEGELETKGILIIGEKANVKAKIIKGENITISGKVKGDILSSKRLVLSSTAKVIGNVETPVLIVNEGAILKGECQMPIEDEKSEPRESAEKKK